MMAVYLSLIWLAAFAAGYGLGILIDRKIKK